MRSSVERMELVDSLSISEGNCSPSRSGWFSPRISFSHDFAMLGEVLPDARKSDYAFDDDLCTEFEFSMANANLTVHPSSPMLSAEELFVNGTLRPFHLFSRTGSNDDLISRNYIGDMGVCTHAARHLSFENSRCSSMRFENASGNVGGRSCISLGNSRCASPLRSFSLPLTTPASPKAYKQSNRFKYFFSLGRLHASTPKDIRQYKTSLSLKLPLSPRSFCSFFRSKSAGEAKINTAAPVVTRSSSSADDNTPCTLPPNHHVDDENETIGPTHTAICASLTESIKEKKIPFAYAPPRHSEVDSKVENSSSITVSSSVSTTKRGNAMEPLCSQGVACCLSGVSPSLPRPTTLDEVVFAALQTSEELHTKGCTQNDSTIDAENTVSKDSEEHATLTSRSSTTTSKASGGLGIVHERVGSNSEVNVGCICSGEWINATSRANTNRFVLRNLERCSASFNRSTVRPQNRRGRNVVGRSEKVTANSSFSASVRVTPVLNVPAGPPVMTAGKKASKSSLFILTSLFSKEGKPPPQQISSSATPSITCWRDGRVGNSSSSSSSTTTTFS
eukprot:c17967_g1_i1 orf=320-2008(+)